MIRQSQNNSQLTQKEAKLLHIIYHLFRHCVYLKENVAGTPFRNPAFDSVLLLSFLESFNVIIIAGFFVEELPLTTTFLLDVILITTLLLGANSLYFLRGKRYRNSYKSEFINFLSIGMGFSPFHKGIFR